MKAKKARLVAFSLRALSVAGGVLLQQHIHRGVGRNARPDLGSQDVGTTLDRRRDLDLPRVAVGRGIESGACVSRSAQVVPHTRAERTQSRNAILDSLNLEEVDILDVEVLRRVDGAKVGLHMTIRMGPSFARVAGDMKSHAVARLDRRGLTGRLTSGREDGAVG